MYVCRQVLLMISFIGVVNGCKDLYSHDFIHSPKIPNLLINLSLFVYFAEKSCAGKASKSVKRNRNVLRCFISLDNLLVNFDFQSPGFGTCSSDSCYLSINSESIFMGEFLYEKGS